MDRINFFRMISNTGGLDPADMILQYFNQIMYLYNLYDPSSKLLDIIKDNNSISFRIEYPYQISGTDIGVLIDQINNQRINVYESQYMVSVDKESPNTVLITFVTITQ